MSTSGLEAAGLDFPPRAADAEASLDDLELLRRFCRFKTRTAGSGCAKSKDGRIFCTTRRNVSKECSYDEKYAEKTTRHTAEHSARS